MKRIIATRCEVTPNNRKFQIYIFNYLTWKEYIPDYVEHHIIRVMCHSPLCDLWPGCALPTTSCASDR